VTEVIRLGYPFMQRQRISNPYSVEDKHEGVDFAAVRSEDYAEFYGTPTIATHDAQILIGYSITGYGLYVYLKSLDDRFATLHAHLSETIVPDREIVRKGDVIGLVGCTGKCKPPGTRGTHLHFGFRTLPVRTKSYWDYGYVDPIPFMEML